MTTIGSLFTGYGGLDMAVEAVTGARTIWCSDIDPGACKILARRFPDVPNLGDITAIDWMKVERPAILTGGFPCQDVSMAGRRAGMKPGTRSGLWQKMLKAIDVLRPPLMVAENVRGLLSADAHSDVEPCPWCVGDPESEPPLRALGAVLGDLADIGYDAAWHGLTAASVGAPHGRFRVFIVAWPSADTRREHGQRWADEIPRSDSPARSSDRPRQSPSPAADADRLGYERAGSAWGRRRGSADSGELPANPDITGSQGPQSAPSRDLSDGCIAADAASDGWDEGWTEPAGLVRGSDAAERGDAAADPDIAWGQFEPAIRRWERLTRPAPAPTETSSRGAQRLSPLFVEWMMGLPDGHVTGVPDLTRNEQLKALGNGVVPAQAVAALRILLPVIP